MRSEILPTAGCSCLTCALLRAQGVKDAVAAPFTMTTVLPINWGGPSMVCGTCGQGIVDIMQHRCPNVPITIPLGGIS
jgi:hypothetical protein